MKTFCTLFSGGGVADCGFAAAGLRGLWAVEFEPKIADVYRRNFPDHHCITSRVEDVDFYSLPRADHGHASPVCKEFSNANKDGEEGELDISSAQAVVRYLKAQKPDTFTLENVWKYRTSVSFGLILGCLECLGYFVHYEHLDAADFGVPQNRKRLILRASLDMLPVLPSPVPWKGWYEAIEDLIPGLPASAFAEWQLSRMDPAYIILMVGESYDKPTGNEDRKPQQRRPDEPAMALTVSHCQGKYKAFIMRGGDKHAPISNDEECSPTITTIDGTHPVRAFIVHATDQRTMPVRDGKDPMFTVMAGAGKSGNIPRAFIACPNGEGTSFIKPSAAPSGTIAADHYPGSYRAFIVDGQANKNGETLTVRDSQEPFYTVAASADKRPARAWLSQGRVVKMTSRALARFQSIPDWYELPENNKTAATVIGNGFPSLWAQRIAEGFYPR